ncbi:MAG: OmpA family protein [Glaciecola sp.]
MAIQSLLKVITIAYDEKPSDCETVVKHIPFILLHASLELKYEYSNMDALLDVNDECVELIKLGTKVYKESIAAAPAVLSEGKAQKEALNSVESQSILYFDFNQHTITTAKNVAILEAHAGFLLRYPTYGIIIEGYADTDEGIFKNEADTTILPNEHSINLGEKRALAIRQFLLNSGVAMVQMNVVSYGDLKPLSIENTEPARALNRRTVIVYE